jgi:hypothetical protein
MFESQSREECGELPGTARPHGDAASSTEAGGVASTVIHRDASDDFPSWSRQLRCVLNKASASGLEIVLPEIADSDHVRGTGPMDSTETAGHSVAAVEAELDPCPRTDATRLGPCPSLGLRNERPRPLVECRRKPHEPSGSDPLSAPAWSGKPPFGVSAFYAFNLNRRVRNRTHGRVGGRGR